MKGVTQSTGHSWRFKDITGQKFGRLTALEFAGHIHGGTSALWACVCECGKRVQVSGVLLRNGTTRSCGCLNRDRCGLINKTHGLRRTPEYGVWASMRKRCMNSHCKEYSRYGGRGIRVCQRWDKFENFLADMGQRPPGAMLERINNNGDYEPLNCKWATQIEQANNTRTNRVIEFGGKAQTVAMWAREIGVPPGRIYYRLYRGIPGEAVIEKLATKL